MARHRLSPIEMLAGVEAALRSKRTPSHLRAALRRRHEELKRKLGTRRRRRRSTLVGWFSL